MRHLAYTIACGLVATPVAASGFEGPLRMFGHEVRIEQKNEVERRLMIGDVEVVSAWHISIGEVAVVEGVPVLLGLTSSGGNACAGSAFVISFPAAGRPRTDGPLETCGAPGHTIDGDRITFSTGASAGRDGESWAWRADHGFEQGDPVRFAADPQRGWRELRERTATHPSDLFSYGEIAAEVGKLAGEDEEFVTGVLNGVGSAKFDGDWFAGMSCTPHMCMEEEAIIVASLTDRSIYLAWKPERGKIVVRPVVTDWPERAKRELRVWAEKWK